VISPTAVALADLNNNGILDLIVATAAATMSSSTPDWGMGLSGPRSTAVTVFFTGHQPGGYHGR